MDLRDFHSRSPADCCGKLSPPLEALLLLLPRIVCGYVGEERATRCYDCRLQYVETSRAECRAAGCTLFPNEYSDVVWSRNPTLL